MIVPGTVISHYRILDQLGAGGMGVVFRAVDVKLDRVVAIKFLPPHLGANETARARFIAEAKAASALDFPNIGTIHEVDEAPGAGLFIVMAYYAGESLATRLHRGRIPTPQAVDIALQVGEGLSRAHEHRIVHRDIKPSNLILTPSGLVKIVDFGLAKVADLNLTEAGLTLGTPMFMAPEQVEGAAVDHRCDIWSLGVVLYYMLSGRLPFPGHTSAEVLKAIRERDVPPIDAPPGLQAVLARALAKRLRDRYASARAFIVDLRASYEGVPTSAQPGESTEGSGFDTGLTGDEPTEEARAPLSILQPPSAGERRQLTIVSCELVEYPQLTERLDPEALSAVLRLYRRACEEAILPLDGHIVQQHEATLTVHFGLPEAHEDDAARAVTAAQAIVAAVSGVSRQLGREHPGLKGVTCHAQIGVHTGPVIVDSDLSASSQTVVVGMTGALAAKTRDVAEPNHIVLTEDTYRLVKRSFQVRPLGETRLPGVTKPQSLYRVEATTPAAQTTIVPVSALTELVGRARELGLLSDRWEEVKEGSGQVVLLSADAGVGKSRLVDALKQTLAGEAYLRLECRCSPYHRNSPLWPVVDLLGRLFAIDRSRSTEEMFGQISANLTAYGLGSSENAYLTAGLLAVPVPDGFSRPNIPPQREKERTLAFLLKLLLVLTSRQPVLFLVEDLHWVDPTTLELLGLVVDQGPTAPLFTILTFRPEFSSPWDNRAHLTQLSLNRLSKRDAERLIEKLSGGKTLPRDVVDHVLSNSDGVPLYIEELTKALLESDALRETADGYALQMTASLAIIPTTLQDSLTARLDRLGSAKEVAQMASVLGRTFRYDWLQTISPLGEQLLRRDLARLVDAGLLYQKGVVPDASFTFKHALIKDAAYQALLTPARQLYHSRIAHALHEQFRDIAASQPELLAHHYAGAGLTEQAILQWKRAGLHAARQSAYAEAASHFRRALELIRTLEDTAEHAEQELDLLVSLGSVLLATLGYAAPAVGDVYTQALKLSEKVGGSRRLFDVLQGLFNYYLVRSELRLARTQSDRLLELASTLQEPEISLEASLRQGVALYAMGSPQDARAHLQTAAAFRKDTGTIPRTISYGQDPIVAARCHLAVVDWLLGFPQRAVADVDAALIRGRELAHPFTLAWALLYEAIVRSLRQEPVAALEPLRELAALCEEQGFAYRLAQSQILRGWALVYGDQGAHGIDQIRLGIARTRATGAAVLGPYYATLLADACLRERQFSLGLDAIDEAIALVGSSEERFMEAELHRLRGELLVAADPERRSEAVSCYRNAIEIAARQRARALELRAAVGLASLHPEDGELKRRVDALAAVIAAAPTAIDVID